MRVNDEIYELSSNLALYCVVRWLSTYNIWCRFVELHNSIITFTKEKGKKYTELENETWLSDLMFFIDEREHLQILNLALPEKEILMICHKLYSVLKLNFHYLFTMLRTKYLLIFYE